jgi:hypothetical protein
MKFVVTSVINLMVSSLTLNFTKNNLVIIKQCEEKQSTTILMASSLEVATKQTKQIRLESLNGE